MVVVGGLGQKKKICFHNNHSGLDVHALGKLLEQVVCCVRDRRSCFGGKIITPLKPMFTYLAQTQRQHLRRRAPGNPAGG